MRYSEIITNDMSLLEASIAKVSPQQALDQHMFGPIYHGTNNIDAILSNGFSVEMSRPHRIDYSNKPVGTSNGYPLEAYALGISAPIHHLGFAAYLTTVKAYGKKYNGGSIKGLKTFYLNSRNVEEINFGAPNTMMKWWIANGYNMTAEATRNRDFDAWVKATDNMTKTLMARCDAVWFKGKGIRRLLDGDQIAVYRPELIVMMDGSMASGMEVGSKVTHTGQMPFLIGHNDRYVDDLSGDDFGSYGKLATKSKGWRGIFNATDREGNDIPRSGVKGIGNCPIHLIPPPSMVGIITAALQIGPGTRIAYNVKWKVGGECYNYAPEELTSVSQTV